MDNRKLSVFVVMAQCLYVGVKPSSNPQVFWNKGERQEDTGQQINWTKTQSHRTSSLRTLPTLKVKTEKVHTLPLPSLPWWNLRVFDKPGHLKSVHKTQFGLSRQGLSLKHHQGCLSHILTQPVPATPLFYLPQRPLSGWWNAIALFTISRLSLCSLLVLNFGYDESSNSRKPP